MPLPAWLVFDPATRSFSGAPPLGSRGVLDVVLTATDGRGREASTTLRLSVEREFDPVILRAPSLSRPALYWPGDPPQHSQTPGRAGPPGHTAAVEAPPEAASPPDPVPVAGAWHGDARPGDGSGDAAGDLADALRAAGPAAWSDHG